MSYPSIPAPRTPRAVRPFAAALPGRLASFASTLALALALVIPLIGLPERAQAIPYFNEPFGFDNSSLGLKVDYVIELSAVFDPIASGMADLDIGLLSTDDVDDSGSGIDRTITWTLINNAPNVVTDFLVFFTAVPVIGFDYSSANFDLDIDANDPMSIISYGSYTFAGYRLTLDDFSLVNGELLATRRFRYTVDVPQDVSGPPNLGIARTSNFIVPEPATGLLLASALLVAALAGAGPRRRS